MANDYKTVRIKAADYNRLAHFGIVGDSIATALTNLLNFAETKNPSRVPSNVKSLPGSSNQKSVLD